MACLRGTTRVSQPGELRRRVGCSSIKRGAATAATYRPRSNLPEKNPSARGSPPQPDPRGRFRESLVALFGAASAKSAASLAIASGVPVLASSNGHY